MSGIAGIIRLDGAPVVATELAAMLAPMMRRGPDRQHVLAHGHAGFGQALLATTPEASAELQPWTHRDSGCIVVSDSRLDNRPELLRTLGMHDRAVDDVGDGELLHAAYQHWGKDCAQHLLGDFAFALWDPRQQSLLCARDIMGVRPFYYHHAPGRLFAFASECAALLTIPGVSGEIDEGRVADGLLGLTEGIDRTSTFYLSIKRLPPARVLSVGRASLVQTEYWQPIPERPVDLPRSAEDWTDAVASTLRESVRRRLRGSSRAGSMLSGGLDSSSVSALAHDLQAAHGGEHLATISAIDSHGQGAETEAIEAMLASRDFDASVVDLANLGEITTVVRRHLQSLSEPFDGTMTLVSAVYAVAASRGIRCVLDGMPADNLYSLGNWQAQLVRRGRLPTFWREVSAMHARNGEALPHLRTARSLLGALAPDAIRQRWERRQDVSFLRELAGTAFISPEFAARNPLGQRYFRKRADMHATRLHTRDWSAHSSMTAAYITAAVERYNRVATHFGVEPRHPFLDRHVIELHAWLPSSLRLRDGHHKWALRHAMRDMLPAAVAWRRDKQHLGYRFNRAIWGGVEWQDPAASSLLRESMGVQHLESVRAASTPLQDPGREAALLGARTVMAWATNANSWPPPAKQGSPSQI